MTDSAKHHLSPLRYPGGKAKLAPLLKSAIRKNGLLDRVYVEPFAGGAGVALALLLHGYVKKIVINDLNPPVYAFWQAVLKEPERFCDSICTVDLSMEEWRRQREIFVKSKNLDFDLGFATFFLNRTNHSGVLNGGVIGGKDQKSKYKIDARFNRTELCARIERISKYKENIVIQNRDAVLLLDNLVNILGSDDYFVYADPPYVNKGPDLYYNFFKKKDHEKLARSINELSREISWCVSYDFDPLVLDLYAGKSSACYNLSYSVKNGGSGTEVIFFSDDFFDLSDFFSVQQEAA